MSLITLLIPVIALLQPAAGTAKFSAKLYASDEAVSPGGKTELALELTVEEGYHVYYPIQLDVGGPTQVRLAAAPGVTFDALRYPVPELREDEELRSLILEGTFVVLTTMHVAADTPPGPIDVRAAVRALACKELCFPVQAEAGLRINVAAQPSKPAHADLFEQARDLLPQAFERAKYIEGSSLAVTKDKLGVDEEAEIVVTIRVKKGHHIQDRDPGVEGLIPTHLFVEPLDGLKFDDQIWPAPRVHEIEGTGKVRELAGEFKVRVPLKIIDREFPSGPVALRVLLTYQCCIDTGTCYPPEAAEGVARFVAQTSTEAVAGPRGTLFPGVLTAAELPVAPLGSADPAPLAAKSTDLPTLLWNLLLGFFGGMILNITPCVFPVISIKILGFVNQAGEDRRRVFKLGLTFAAGVMVWFWAFGILTSLGEVPLQYPPVTIALAAILFVLSLSLFGVYEILLPGAAAGKLGDAAGREGYGGAFMNGFLATLLGTACTAPLFAAAAAYAATAPRTIALLIFTSAGLGMSLPYVLLSAFPQWLKKLPRPGPWMVTFKQVMGFIIIATVIWLLNVIGKQTSTRGVIWTIAFLLFLSVSAWLIGRIQLNWETPKRVRHWLAAVAMGAFGLWFSLFYMYDLRHAEPELGPTVAGASDGGRFDDQFVDGLVGRVRAADWVKEIPWQPWQPGLADDLCRRGYTVYVDYTADWCVNCKTNLYTSLEITSTRLQMRQLGVIPIVADYTKPNPGMRRDLLRFGFNSVPMNLIYPAGRPEGVVSLPVLFTPGIVQDNLAKAGPSSQTGNRAAQGL